VNTGQANNGLPQFVYGDYAQPYQYARYGLINNGPLQGIAFDVNGTPYNFNYGSGGAPTGTGAVTGCFPATPSASAATCRARPAIRRIAEVGAGARQRLRPDRLRLRREQREST
jgi:hypothetical protein